MKFVQQGLAMVVVCSTAGMPAAWAQDARVSLYKPENGPALNLYAGVDLTPFVTAQANYVWNRNDVTLFSSFLSPSGGGFYEQARTSGQHAVVGDLLLYFRRRGSGVRPYLSTGVGLVRFNSGAAGRAVESGAAAPVGIDLALGVGVAGDELRGHFAVLPEHRGKLPFIGKPVGGTRPGRHRRARHGTLFGSHHRVLSDGRTVPPLAGPACPDIFSRVHGIGVDFAIL